MRAPSLTRCNTLKSLYHAERLAERAPGLGRDLTPRELARLDEMLDVALPALVFLVVTARGLLELVLRAGEAAMRTCARCATSTRSTPGSGALCAVRDLDQVDAGDATATTGASSSTPLGPPGRCRRDAYVRAVRDLAQVDAGDAPAPRQARVARRRTPPATAAIAELEALARLVATAATRPPYGRPSGRH